MRLVRCNAEARHYYNADEFNECPECLRLAQGSGTAPAPRPAEKRTQNGTLSLDDLNKRLSTIEKQRSTTLSGEQTASGSNEENLPEPDTRHSLLQKFFRKKEKTVSPAPAESVSRQPAPQSAPMPEEETVPETEPDASDDHTPQIFPDDPPSQPEPPQEQGSLASSVAAVQRTHQNNSASNKTIAYYSLAGSEPVVGWLVGVKGVYQGESFSLVTGQNFIGRSLSMHIILRNDQTVSRDNHAVIMFEPQKQVFYLMSGQSTGITYLNGAPVLMPSELHPYDQIKVGDTLLVFVPFCGPNFRWDDYIKKDNAE